MTYANPTLVSTVARKTKDLEPLYGDSTAVGEESSFIYSVYERSVKHYFLPYSRQWANPLTRFLTLKKEWEDNTAYLSSMTKIVMHPAYQQIIGMGQVAIPLILSEMRKKPDHWFWALRSITGKDPVLSEHRGRFKQMTEDWLKWGRENGYIA